MAGSVTPPGSKSYTNRAFLVACLARGSSRIHRPLMSDDTLYMLSSLKYLGFRMSQDPADGSVSVEGGRGGVPWDKARLYVGNAGTAMRFLTAVAALGRGTYTVDGDERMRQRPIGPLSRALADLGASVTHLEAPLCPPLRIAGGPVAGGSVTLDGSVSSQFLSALLMTGRCMERGLTVDVEGELTSLPYVDLTLDVMGRFGGAVENDGYRRFRVDGAGYDGASYAVEADASAASYFFAAAAITGGRVTVRGLGRNSLQGDLGFATVLESMGCLVDRSNDGITVQGAALHGVDVDMNDMPDVVPTLAPVALFADSPTTVRNVANLRVKESDRIAAVASELGKVGARVEERDDGLTVHPCPNPRGMEIETYDDHRIAMSFAILGLKVPGTVILNPSCVSKTYPDFFEDLEALCQA